MPVDSVPPFPAIIPPAPSPFPSVQAATATTKPSPARPAGTYRPPGARRQSASLAYSREEDGASPSWTPCSENSGTATPTRQLNGHGRRYVPGAAASPPPDANAGKQRPKEKEVARGDGGAGARAWSLEPSRHRPLLEFATAERAAPATRDWCYQRREWDRSTQ
jgi:translation initiation factor 2A